MNDVRPFRGLRFDETVVGPIGQLLCPPYDVISAAEQVALHNRSRYNAVRLELGFEHPDDSPANNRYTRAAATLKQWLAEGVLRPEKQPALYLYEQQFPLGEKMLVRRGLLARLRLARWEEGVVLPHEETLAKPKEDRLQLMRATRCNLSPLFLLFEDRTGTAQELMASVAAKPPTVVADTQDGQSHRLWVVRGAEQQRLVAAFRSPQLYMADGHHRYETALAYRDERRRANPASATAEQVGLTAEVAESPAGDPAYEFAMVLLVDAWDPGLVVLPTHRLVRGVDPAMIQGLDGALPGLFDVERLALDGRSLQDSARLLLQRMQELGCEGATFGIYRPQPHGAAVLRLRTSPENAPRSRPLLDVDVLHDMLMAPLMGIGPDHLKAETHVAYTRDAAEALAAVDRGDAQVALLLNPTRVEQVLSTARARGKMPQKSTYFYPKPATGLVFNPL